jgi:hypothetical protein
MTVTGIFKSVFADYTNCDFESCCEFCFIGTERHDWEEEHACSRFVAVVNSIILVHILYIYVLTVYYMILYSVNTAHIELYLFNYSIVYSVQLMQYNTAIYFSISTAIGIWTVMFSCMTPCRLVYF